MRPGIKTQFVVAAPFSYRLHSEWNGASFHSVVPETADTICCNCSGVELWSSGVIIFQNLSGIERALADVPGKPSALVYLFDLGN